MSRAAVYRGRIRAGLITPGTDPEKLAKAAASSADYFHLELEDGVPPNRKQEARQHVLAGLRGLPWRGRPTFVRVNPVASGFLEEDVATVSAGDPTAFILAKCQGPDDIRYLDERIGKAERQHGLERGSIQIISMIERIKALVSVHEIAVSSPRMLGLYIGPADLGSEVGYRRSYEDIELETYHPKAVVIVAAHAAGLLAIDSACARFRDLELTRKQAAWSAQIGFDAKSSISPRQIDVVREAFAPSDDEVTWAEAVLAGKEAALKESKSVWEFDGMFLDEAMVARAEAILESRPALDDS